MVYEVFQVYMPSLACLWSDVTTIVYMEIGRLKLFVVAAADTVIVFGYDVQLSIVPRPHPLARKRVW